MKLLPFDLQHALAGDKVVTRDGREVTQLTKFDAENSNFCLIGVCSNEIESWDEKGRFFSGDEDYPRDLFMTPKTVKRWVNFYADGDAFYYDCEHDAIENVASHAIAVAVPVEFEEGYGCE